VKTLTGQPEKFKAQIVYLAPIVASLLFGLLCATLLQKPTPSAPPVYPVTPISQTTPEGPYFNAIYFVVIIGVGASVLYLLIKYRNRKTLNFLTGFAITTAFVLLSYVYFSTALSFLQDSLLITTALAIVVTVVADFVIFKVGGRASDAVVVGLGGALGVFLGANLNIPTALLILSFLAVYDIIAVYRGPVGKIANSGLDQLKGLSFSFKEFQMGLGDLVFYSLLAGTMFINLNLVACLASMVGILVGSYLTFLVLEKREVFPGLPFPIALGIAFGVIAGLLF
jgi:presenilin-like A22 family membrane protease